MGITFFPANGDNRPTGWTQAVQQGAGNTVSDQMTKIALAGYPIPQLYMAPVSVFTQVNGQVPGQCIGSGAANGVLTRPAAFTLTWALAGTGGVLGPFTKGSKQDPPANVTLKLVPQLPDVSNASMIGIFGGSVIRHTCCCCIQQLLCTRSGPSCDLNQLVSVVQLLTTATSALPSMVPSM